MTKKTLNVENIANELEGASLFFTKPPSSPLQPVYEEVKNDLPDSPTLKEAEVPAERIKKISKPKEEKAQKIATNNTVIPRNHDTTVSRYRDTTTPRIHGVAIEHIRKAVKEFGKEAATHRFTEAEKREIADLIYTYKNRGIKTSENEITRISVNFVMEDYKENGENSVLHKILEALNE